MRVDYEVGMRGGITYDDAMKNLTTEILSDNAPDIIMLDGMDINNLEEKNILTDLSENEKQWNPENVLFDNIAKWNNDGGLYSIAGKFKLPVIIADKKDLENISAYSSFCRTVERLRNECSNNSVGNTTFNPDKKLIMAYGTNEDFLKLGLTYYEDQTMSTNTLSTMLCRTVSMGICTL